MADLRLVMVGLGAIGARVVELLAERAAPVDLVGVGVRNGAARREGLPAQTVLISDPAELAALRPALVVESGGTGRRRWSGARAPAGGCRFLLRLDFGLCRAGRADRTC